MSISFPHSSLFFPRLCNFALRVKTTDNLACVNSLLFFVAILNAIWDLWAKYEKKPVWKLLVDMEPEKLISVIDFRYITDVLTPVQALEILKQNAPTKGKREEEMLREGYPAYNTSVGWIGYSDDKIRRLCKEALTQGWTTFKMKVGANLDDDKRRAGIIREEIGWHHKLAVDANQRWYWQPTAITSIQGCQRSN